MLEEELWVSRLADDSNIDLALSKKLWEIVVDYFTRLIEQDCIVSFLDTLYMYKKMEKESLALLPDGSYFLLPPHIILNVDFINKNIECKQQQLFNDKILTDLSGISHDTVRVWCESAKKIFAELMNLPNRILLKGLMHIVPVYNGNTLVGITGIFNKSIQEKINNPFCVFEPIKLDNILGNEDLSVVKLDDISQWNNTGKPFKVPFFINSINEEIKSDESITEEDIDDISKNKISYTIEKKEDSVLLNNSEDKESFCNDLECKGQSKKCFNWVRLLQGIVILVIIFVLIKFIWKQIIPSDIHRDKHLTVTKYANNSLKGQQNVVVKKNIIDTTNLKDTILLKSNTQQQPSSSVYLNKSDEIEYITIKNGDRLTLFSLKKYGNKVFWVYIYEENKSRISNPDNIPIGTRLVLPSAKKYKIDAEDNNSINAALLLEKRIKNIN